MRRQWEYTHLLAVGWKMPEAERKLNEMGAEGWEVYHADERERTVQEYSESSGHSFPMRPTCLFLLKRRVAPKRKLAGADMPPALQPESVRRNEALRLGITRVED